VKDSRGLPHTLEHCKNLSLPHWYHARPHVD
jgi:hypothetical protein